MTDPRAALAELVADVRSLLEDALARGARLDPEGEPVPEPRPEPTTPPSRWAAIAEAHRQAEPVDTLGRVREDLGECQRCRLHKGRTHLVFGVGDPEADLVVVGEGPGQQEDLRGEPFVGPAGEMLDRMLANVLGLSRSEVYICNVVKCRPPGNRNPEPDEIAACRPFLERQIRVVRPKVLLVLGSVAYRTLLDPQGGIKRGRGIWRTWEGIPTLATFHPAYLLRQPDDKRLAFEDLKSVRARYDALGGKRSRLF